MSVEKYWGGDDGAPAGAWARDKELRITGLKIILEEERREHNVGNSLLPTLGGGRSQRPGKGDREGIQGESHITDPVSLTSSLVSSTQWDTP